MALGEAAALDVVGNPPDEGPLSAAGFFRSVFGGLIVGVVAIVFSISFVAIIYSGDMAPYLNRGIGLTLAGAAIMAVVGAFALSYRGTIVQPQDVTAIILSLAVASIATGWSSTTSGDRFATVAVLVAVATALTGVAGLAFGWLRLGFIVRFMPYPVLGGFLAATGYFLLSGAIGMAAGQRFDLWHPLSVLGRDSLMRWVPWISAAFLFYLVSRRFKSGLALPACIALAVASFYFFVWASGIGLSGAQARGLLLGPFESGGFLDGLRPSLVVEANWSIIFQQVPTLLAVVGLATVGTLLNLSGLELATGKSVDPNRELRGIGATNLAASLFGGMVGYHLLSQTLFARALGVRGRIAGLSVGGLSAAALFFGAEYLSVLPVGIFAAVIAFLGIDLLVSWLWLERRRLPLRDFLVVLLILGVAATIGILEAVAIGTIVAALLFVSAYAGIETVRLKTNVANRRSNIERGPRELAILNEHGRRTAVYELSGYLFFGTAGRMIAEIADWQPRPVDAVVLDFRRVPGIDASAAFALRRMVRESIGPTFMLTGLSARLRQDLERSGLVAEGDKLRFFDRMDDALQAIEERILHAGEQGSGDRDALAGLRGLFGHEVLDAYFEKRQARAGEVVMEQGSHTDGMAFLLCGRLLVELATADGQTVKLARIEPGAVVGEIGFYADVARSANVVAESDCSFYYLSFDMLSAIQEEHPRLLAEIHRLAASNLALRLQRTTALLRDADL